MQILSKTSKFLLTITFCMSVFFTQAQNKNVADSNVFLIEQKLPVPSKFINCDKLGNIYVVDESERLIKYNSSGVLLSTLNYTYNGSISSVDVSNPMEIYLFYKELSMVILLDNNLAFRGKINLQDWGITQASCIARSYENGLWVFDAGDLQLKKFGRDGKLLQSSGNAMDFAGDEKFNPVFCAENGNRLLLADTLNGLFLFDVFAGFIKKIPIQSVKSVQFLESEMIIFKEESLIIYHLLKFSRNQTSVPFPGIKSAFRINSNKFIFNTSQSILITNMAK